MQDQSTLTLIGIALGQRVEKIDDGTVHLINPFPPFRLPHGPRQRRAEVALTLSMINGRGKYALYPVIEIADIGHVALEVQRFEYPAGHPGTILPVTLSFVTTIGPGVHVIRFLLNGEPFAEIDWLILPQA